MMAARKASPPSSQVPQPQVLIDPATGYFSNIDAIREAEYPALQNTTYLDHAGTTLYARSLIESYAKDLVGNLYGNPHSASASSQLSSRRIDDVRLQVLRFFNANPDDFDLVFVANATAAIKLVGDAFRDHPLGFDYHYHAESHTSLIGLRELASPGSHCLPDDAAVDGFLAHLETADSGSMNQPSLFAYPAQSNMTGRRLPLGWCGAVGRARQVSGRPVFTLLDAAALVSTAPLDLSDVSTAPDFTAVSFYKIFGFPDLGALIVRKASGDILHRRRYFGGGTVDAVVTFGPDWHAKKASSLHSGLEDGTLPFHSIIALQFALDAHRRIYGSMSNIAKHTDFLASLLRSQLRDLCHGNGQPICSMFTGNSSQTSSQGPVIALVLKDSEGKYVSNSEFEKLTIVKNIQVRTGGLCNPGGVALHLGLSPEELRQNYDTGQRCGDEIDMLNGKPTGAIRLSLGAMSSKKDIESFVEFVREFYIDSTPPSSLERSCWPPPPFATPSDGFFVESLSVFPIKSCAAYQIPPDVSWRVGPRGLAWDREWCLVHEGTHVALSQKRYPRMALLKPEIDVERGLMRVTFEGGDRDTLGGQDGGVLEISLDPAHPASSIATHPIGPCVTTTGKSSSVCGEDVHVQVYTSAEVSEFFTRALGGVPATLARFPSGDGVVRRAKVRIPPVISAHDGQGGRRTTEVLGRSIALSNESPILLVSRSSVNRLNEDIKQQQPSKFGRTVTADSFRANIVVAQDLPRGRPESPYVEDEWKFLQIGEPSPSSPGGGGGGRFEILGPCQRCQMVCVDQTSARRGQEPFSTLAKTRRRDGRVWFGMHMSVSETGPGASTADAPPVVTIKVGDRIFPTADND